MSAYFKGLTPFEIARRNESIKHADAKRKLLCEAVLKKYETGELKKKKKQYMIVLNRKDTIKFTKHYKLLWLAKSIIEKSNEYKKRTGRSFNVINSKKQYI